MLLNRGVKSNAKNHRGETALHVMSRGKYDLQDGVRVAQLLLERGVDVNTQDKDHNSPLHLVSYSGKLEIARVFLDRGAKANAKNDREETPLHQVSQGEYESQVDGVRIVQLLLDRGVDVSAQDKNGVTPLHLATWCGKLEITQLLLEYATLKNNRATALHISIEGEYHTQEHKYSSTHTESPLFRAYHGLERPTKRPRNRTTLCMLPGEARDRTAASRPWCTSEC